MSSRLRWRKLFVCVLAVAIAGGCAGTKEIARLEQVGTISGTVRTEDDSRRPLILALYAIEESGPRLFDYLVKDGPGPYQFLVLPGKYRLVAFRDVNRSFSFQAGEPAAPAGRPATMIINRAENVAGPDLSIASSTPVNFSPDIDLSNPAVFRSLAHKTNIGRVVKLDDERFSETHATQGIWQPFTFMDTAGAGIFFLGEYDPAKVPVLFIHGMAGTPRVWQPIIESMDRSRFQPWFYHYPSGVRLGMLAWYLDEAVRELRARYGFNRLFVVAYSMGGLVGREFVNRNVGANNQKYVQLFVSISTPWNGAPLAKLGIHVTPVVVPSWIDMAPDSEFLSHLFDSKLPPYVQSHLLFSYGGNSIHVGGKDDGVVLLTSQLRPDAQREAMSLFGVNADHSAILSDHALFRHLNEILRGAYDRRAGEKRS